MSDRDGSRRMTLVVPLDRGTADRLLAGTLEPDDAPPGYADVTRLMRALGRPPTVFELGREDEAVAVAAAIRARRTPAVEWNRGRAGRRSSRLAVRARVIGLVAAGAVVATSGLAFAGALPDTAQNVVSDALALIGITVPSAEELEPAGGPRPAPARPSRAAGAGGVVIGDAAPHTTDPSRAHPNEPRGGTSIADAASGGASEHGTSIANERSGGHSAAGSANAAHGPGPNGHGPDPDPGRGPGGGRGHGPPASQGHGQSPPPGHPPGPPPGHPQGPPPGHG